ncbi:MAG: ferredoxin--NADP reductase [Flavobacterium sp.]|nr:ferredoxin--NADP reductase [Flavobacterium sp.]
MIKYTLKIQEIRKETKDTITLCFKQPALRKMRYQAGQYISLSFRINGRKYTRPYSFSSSPSGDVFLETTVKRIPNGILSNHIHNHVQVGDVVEVLEPMGDFVHEEDETFGEIFFWGVGSGITPLISIIKEVLISNSGTKVNLIYGNKNFESTIFLELINELLVKYPDQLTVWHFHSQYEHSENHHFVRSGRINKDFMLELLKNKNIGKTKHYICGPKELKTTIIDVLSQIHCPQENIFSEEFELVKNPKDFEGIETHTVHVKFQGNEIPVAVAKGKSVLEAALDAGIELPYSCQTGSCSQCKGKAHEGDLKMIGLTKERTDLQKGEFLLCCSHPLKENVCIEV